MSGLLYELTGQRWGLIIPLWVGSLFLIISTYFAYILRPHVLHNDVENVMSGGVVDKLNKNGKVEEEEEVEDVVL